MIRILIFGLTTGLGGVGTYLMNLYRNIDRNVIQFDFVVEGDMCYFADEIQAMGGKIYYIKPKRKNVFLNIKDLWILLKKCRKNYKMIYFNFSVLYYNVPFILSKLFRYPIIIAHGHNTCPKNMKNIRYLLHCINRYYVSHFSNYLFACSSQAGEWVLGKKAVEEGKVKVIPNAINAEIFKYNTEIRSIIRNELRIDKENFVVGNIGRVTYQKNQIYLIDIFKEIKKKYDKAILLLVGDGELMDDINKKIHTLDLSDSVILTGARSDVSKLLQAMDVFVFPSLFEGLGIVLLEAQASGLLCFASKGVIPEQVNVTGNVKFIDLNKGPAYWAEQILKYSIVHKRKDMTETVKISGYDIKDLATNFQEFIISVDGNIKDK